MPGAYGCKCGKTLSTSTGIKSHIETWSKKEPGKHERVDVASSNAKRSEEEDGIPKEAVAYAVGHCETWLQLHAEAIAVPTIELTKRVAQILLSKTRR